MKWNSLVTRLVLLLIFLVMVTTGSAAQCYGPTNTEFGSHYVSINPSQSVSLYLYPTPAKSNRPFARFDMGMFEDSRAKFIPRSSVTLLNTNAMQNMSGKIIEVFPVDEYAMPVLAFSKDSAWVSVSLDCRNQINPPTAWLNVLDAGSLKVQVKSWSAFFESDRSVRFICDSMLAFYSQPDLSTRIFPKVLRFPDSFDYCLKVIKKSGQWMQVFLETPSPFGSYDPSREADYKSVGPPQKVWIKYLDDRGQPRIWYRSE